MNQTENHKFHGNTWSYKVPHREELVCFACLSEILEDDEIIMVKKRPALAEALHLIHHHDFISDLQGNIEVPIHFSFVLIDIMESAESSFASSAVEVFLKLMSKMDSRDLLENVLDHIQRKMFQTENPKELHPLIVLLGRLVKAFAPLSRILCQEYEQVLQCLVNGLSNPDEEFQSNTVYLFVYVLVGPWEAVMPVSVQHALAQEVVCLLHTAKAPYLLRNLMALLKKLISSAELTQILMTLDLNNLNLLTSLKKLIISKNSDLQRSALYVLSCILSQENEDYCRTVLNCDIIEFMFEALHCQSPDQLKFVLDSLESLCHSDLFYTKCHAVYGLESIFYALESLLEKKNFELCKTGFDILAALLTRQPSSVPLFINTPTLTSCLELISLGIQEQHPEVFVSSMQSLCAVIKKNHLLLPVPFEVLKRIIELMINKLLKVDMSLGSIVFRDKNGVLQSSEEKKWKDPIEIVILIHGACFQLLEECWDDPLTCATNYVSTDSQSKETSLQQFKKFIINSVIDNVVPLAMKSMIKGGNPLLCRQLQKLLLELYSADHGQCTQLLIQMISEGFLSTVINRRQESSEMLDSENKFMLQLCHVLHEEDTPELPFPDWVDTGILNLKNNLNEYQITLQHMSDATRNLYLFLIYHMCKLDDIPLSGQEILTITNGYVESIYSQMQLSPLEKKQLVFLWAFSVSLLQNNIEKHNLAGDLVLRTVCEESPSLWFTHHSAFLYWVFLDLEICNKAGPQIIDCWLNGIVNAQEDDSDDFIENLEDVHHLYEMFANAEFTEAFMMTLVSFSRETASLSCSILKNFLAKILETDMSENFILCVRGKGRQLLQEVFLREDKSLKDDHLKNILSILMITFNTFPVTIDGQDLKLLYHVSKWLCESSEEKCSELTEMILRLVIQYIEASDSLHSSVLPMIMQNIMLLKTLEGLIVSENESLSGLTHCILSYIMEFSAQNLQTSSQSVVKIKVPLYPLEKRLKTSSTTMQQCFLQFLATSFQHKFINNIIEFSNEGRYPPDCRCPLISSDITCLFCYLQQFMVQECLKTRQIALHCLQALVTYLSSVDLLLYEELLTHPWNTAMLEVMVQMTDDDTVAIATTFDMLHFILCEKLGNRIVMESFEVIEIVAQFLREQKANSLVEPLKNQCLDLIEKFLKVVPVQYKQQIIVTLESKTEPER
ncbi:meiosis inhibitor protein 1-like [Saccostrea echinata]|uniref:meiosis inhibitor protein 1-like n=1 Tax=Saccostrea echinata TaxID=191078 RepID=UPI002A8233BE|nr:meiosis inhibitor protein 1-like [Saccostrea echinata]